MAEIDARVAFQGLAESNINLAEQNRNLSEQLLTFTRAVNTKEVAQFVPTFSGDSSEFKDWIQAIEKHAYVTGTSEERMKIIAFQTSKSGVSEFIKRYITNRNATWKELKDELTVRFGEINDPQLAFTMLRKVKQKAGESVQLYAERLFSLAQDAFSQQREKIEAAQQQLVGFFVDGLSNDSIRYKCMRDNPQDLQQAVKIALTEQNLRKRFQIRTGHEYNRRTQDSDRVEIPMEVDHMKPTRRCFKCNKKGHFAKDCRSRQRVNAVENAPNQRSSGPTRGYYVEGQSQNMACWRCGEIGHLKRDCPSRRRQNFQRPSLN